MFIEGLCSQGTILELKASQQELEARLKDVSKRFEAAQTAAGTAAQEADQRLKHAQVGVPLPLQTKSRCELAWSHVSIWGPVALITDCL